MGALFASEIVEMGPCDGVDGAVSGEALPSADRGIDIERIELDPATGPADAFGGQQRRAAAHKGVEDEVAARRAIEDRVRDQGDRFHRRVKGGKVPFLAFPSELVGAWVVPDIAAVAAMPTQLDIVPMRGTAVLKYEDQLVLAPVKRAHAGVVLDPDAQVFELWVDSQRGRQQLVLMTPIHTYVME